MGVSADDHAIANLGLVRGGTVDRDHARTFFTPDGVGGEALAVVDVVDLDLFVLADAGQVQPFTIDGAGAFVIEYSVGDFGAMQLGFEHDGVHECFPGRNRTAGSLPEGFGGGNTVCSGAEAPVG